MAWWLPLLLAALFLALPVTAILLLPLRINGQYLREDKKDQLGLLIKLGWLQLSLELNAGAAGNVFRWRLLAGPLRIAVGCKREDGRDKGKGRPPGLLSGQSGRDLLDLAEAVGTMVLRRRDRSLLKKIAWARFDLELSWGGEDPALTAVAAGGCWAFSAILTGLLLRYFSFKTRPRFQVKPLFRPAALRLRWEGEAVLSLYRLLSLRRMVKIIGGVAGGASSH